MCCVLIDSAESDIRALIGDYVRREPEHIVLDRIEDIPLERAHWDIRIVLGILGKPSDKCIEAIYRMLAAFTARDMTTLLVSLHVRELRSTGIPTEATIRYILGREKSES